MQYGGGMPVAPGGPGFGGQGIRPDPASGMKSGGGPMGGGGMGIPMPGGGGMPPPRGGGPQQTPNQPNSGLEAFREQYAAQRGRGNQGQQNVDQANADLRRAQIMGADPMVIARLEQTAMQYERAYERSQQMQYAQQMGEMSQRGPGNIGGGQQPSQLDQNPYLQMLLQAQLGMGGGSGGGSNSGMRGGYGGGGMSGQY